MRPNGSLHHEVRGAGEAILLIHGAYIEDAMLPLANEPALDNYRVIRYHRRGYGKSARHDQPLAIAREAQDARDLLRQSDVESAHIVGYSSGGVVALELALSAPDVVKSLVLIEPAIDAAVAGSSQMPPFLAAAQDLYSGGDKRGAVDAFQTVVAGPAWRDELPRMVPGALEQIENNTDLFFRSEMHAVLAYRFGAHQAGRIRQPVLLVLSGDGAPRAGYAQSLAAWLPQMERFVVTDANHNLPMKQPGSIARRIADFIAGVRPN